ncbi:hypothetical protein BH11PAT2_BH11PAT2_04590 [soil metagenome]
MRKPKIEPLVSPKGYVTIPREIFNRIIKLITEKKYIELIFFYAAAIENEMARLIELNEIWAGRVLKSKAITLEMKKYREARSSGGMTLGSQLNYLRIFVDSSESNKKFLLEPLEEFIDLRNRVIHRLYKQDLTKLELEIFEKHQYYLNLIRRLRTRQEALEKKINLSHRREHKKKAI